MKILMIGDTHGRWFELNRLLANLNDQYDVAIQLGDFGFWPSHYDSNTSINPQNKPLYWIDGNHEHHDILDDLVDGRMEPVRIQENIHYLPRGSVLDLDGYKIMAIGGAYSIDKHMRTEGFDWFRQEEPTYDQCRKILSNTEKIDMIVSHTVPRLFLPTELFTIYKHDSTTDILQECVDKFKPKVGYAGHWHCHYERTIEDCTYNILSNLDGDYGNAWEIVEI